MVRQGGTDPRLKEAQEQDSMGSGCSRVDHIRDEKDMLSAASCTALADLATAAFGKPKSGLVQGGTMALAASVRERAAKGAVDAALDADAQSLATRLRVGRAGGVVAYPDFAMSSALSLVDAPAVRKAA